LVELPAPPPPAPAPPEELPPELPDPDEPLGQPQPGVDEHWELDRPSQEATLAGLHSLDFSSWSHKQPEPLDWHFDFVEPEQGRDLQALPFHLQCKSLEHRSSLMR
jgi:hypothetical protein